MNKFFKEVQKELKVTTFPSRQTAIIFTIFVIAFTALMAVYFGALDIGFGKVIIGFISNY